MNERELCWMTAAELGERIARRDVSPVEVIDAYLARAERLNPHLNSFLTVLAEPARAAARHAEQELARGERRGPLHGVPVALKDIVSTRGVRTTMGSKIFADHVPTADATIVERFRTAGAIVVAKAHTHEFAYGPTSNNPHYGPCRNPWDRQRVPGGSSGGSAASVAAAMVPIAIGSDTGGSIRVPGALCGIIGLKATYGRVSRYGVFAVSWALDHIGPLTRTARDAALALGAIAGHDARDPWSSRAPVPDYAAALSGDVRGLRVGVLREHFDEPLDDEVRRVVAAAVQRLADLGAAVDEVSIPIAAYARPISNVIMGVDSVAVHRQLLRERAADYGADVRQRFPVPVALTGADYVRAQQARTRLIADVGAAHERFDVLVGPTAPIAAPPIGQATVVLGGQELPVPPTLASLTRLSNLTGFPTVSVACGYTAAGLPIGLQIAGRPLEEATVLRVADAYERATADERRRPPVDDLV
ncbi:MAG: amidase [Chloroflexi bacterium]|nr:amidase [Chloroflexota bacterium]